MDNTPGLLVRYQDLAANDRALVDMSFDAGHHSLAFISHFPVGSALRAANEAKQNRDFPGCNMENESYPTTICGERTAGASAVAVGFTSFDTLVCLASLEHPGGTLCGICRQFYHHFGRQIKVLTVADLDRNVYACTVGDLLPAAKGAPVPYAQLDRAHKRLVRRLFALKAQSPLPPAKDPRGAVLIATNAKGRKRHFPGVVTDSDAARSETAEREAMSEAKVHKYSVEVTLAVTVKDNKADNPIDGQTLQVLHGFGSNPTILLVGPDRSIVTTSLEELLPFAFGHKR